MCVRPQCVCRFPVQGMATGKLRHISTRRHGKDSAGTRLFNFMSESEEVNNLYWCRKAFDEGICHANISAIPDNSFVLALAVEEGSHGQPLLVAAAEYFIYWVSIPLLACGAILLRRVWRRFETVDGFQTIREFDQRPPGSHSSSNSGSVVYMSWQNVIYQPHTRLHELPVDRILIGAALGSGRFGLVLSGIDRATGAPCAIKTLQTHCRREPYIKALLDELKILIHLGTHPHIVNLIGALTTGRRLGDALIVVEFCPLGDLEGYLHERREFYIDNFAESDATAVLRSPSGYVSHLNLEPVSTPDLLRWGTQIASAMEHISNCRVIHGDLAARNILLLNRDIAKITDFGLSNKLYEYTAYNIPMDIPLPWRSLAPETLLHRIFTTQSDLWSFGVTLWEMFTLCDVPYTVGVSFCEDFITRLQEGLRLPKPNYASGPLYALMQRCWALQPEDRPSFAEIKQQLEILGEELGDLRTN